jgi:hypothetical protein
VFASGPGNPRRAGIERWVADAVEREDWVPAVSDNGGARQRSAPLVVAACLHAEHPRAGEVGRYRGGEHRLIGVAQLATAVDQECQRRPKMDPSASRGFLRGHPHPRACRTNPTPACGGPSTSQATTPRPALSANVTDTGSSRPLVAVASSTATTSDPGKPAGAKVSGSRPSDKATTASGGAPAAGEPSTDSPGASTTST